MKMKLNVATPWHKESFDRFIHENLPQLLAERVPLAGYEVASAGPKTCSLKVAFSTTAGEVKVEFSGIPLPDEDGIFEVGGRRRIVVPVASSEELDEAEIRCVGEQIYESTNRPLVSSGFSYLTQCPHRRSAYTHILVG